MTGKVGYSLRDLYVQGRTYAPQDQLLKAIGLSQGEAILRFTPFELKERLEQITWIEEAVVQRRLPGTLYIKIRERQPVAFWQHNKKHFLVDPQGVILSCDNIKPFEGLPVIVGDDAPVHAPNILKVLSQYPEVRQQVTALVRVGGRRWDIHLQNKVQVKLPEGKADGALARLTTLLKKNKVNPAELAVIDLRLPDKLVMRLSPAASIQLHGKGKET
jgi:cell division protein FtsQ